VRDCYRPCVELEIEWLGRIEYRDAWARQHELVAARAAGTIGDRLLMLEHPPVLTLGRQADPSFVRATTDELAARGIELIRVERGGEVTYHGPGQLVAYPIVHLAERGVLLRPFVRALEAAMAETAAHYGVPAGRRDGHPGCWVDGDGARPRKVGALGLRIERGVTYHGIALNITTRLADFDLIDPCGMPGVLVTSIAREAGWPGWPDTPTTESVRAASTVFAGAFEQALGAAAGPAAPVTTSTDIDPTPATAPAAEPVATAARASLRA
jgi:lipoate-protein ligase B